MGGHGLSVFLGILDGFLFGSAFLALGLGIGLTLGSSTATLFAVNRLHHDGRTLGCFFGLNDEIAQNGIVVAESVFELFQGFATHLDVHAHIMRFHQFLNRISQLTATPVFEAVHFAPVRGHNGFISFDHGVNLFALIGVYYKHHFVMTHKVLLLWILGDRKSTRL